MDQISGRHRPAKTRTTSKAQSALAKARAAKAERRKATSTSSPTKKQGQGSPRGLGSPKSPKGRTGQKFARFARQLKTAECEYFLMHSGQLDELVSDFQCKVCGERALSCSITERKGFCVKLSVKCSKCEEKVSEKYSSPRVTDEESSRPPFEINRQIVNAFLSIGAGHNAMQRFGIEVGMKVMDISSWVAHFKKIVKEHKSLMANILAKSRAAVRKAYELLDPSLIGKAIIEIAVSIDGSWQKRGHVSLYGIVIIIDILTGLVVDFEILSKFCQLCAISAIELGEDTPEYQIWMAGHVKAGECSKNFDGASGNMEAHGTLSCWLRSEKEAGMRYTTVLADGDGKSHSMLCAKKPYGDNVQIAREECTNHVSKRLGTALRTAAQKDKLGGKTKGALTEVAMKSLQGFYHKAIKQNAPNIEAMQGAIFATLYHCASTDAKPNHDLCPHGSDSWCFYNKRKARGDKELGSHEKMPLFLNQKVFDKIFPIYKRLASDELMERCVRGATQNANEGLHSVVWKKVPKHIFVFMDRLFVGLIKGVGEWNMGCIGVLDLKSEVTGQAVPEASKVSTTIFLLKIRNIIKSLT